MKLYGGIDPGLQGGIAIVREDGSLAAYDRLPFDGDYPCAGMLKIFFSDCETVSVEIQHTRMMQAGASTTMVNYGYILGVLSGHRIKHVPPLNWLKWLHGETYKNLSGASKEQKKKRKEATAKKIIDRYPSQIRPGIKDGITDAIAIALYGMQE